MKHDNHSEMLNRLVRAQDDDSDMREQAREAHAFTNVRNGQWEPHWFEANDKKPRYTFDMVNPIIDQVAGVMDRQDFSVKIDPAGGEATEDLAETFDGLIRNIENISGASDIYRRASREMVTTGISGWRVTQRYVDADSFDQDLTIERIGSFVDRVWFGPHEEPDASDAREAWVLTGITKEEYEERFPDKSERSVSTDKRASVYFNKPDLVMVGEYLYLKEVPRELVMMTNGKVYEDNEDFQRIADELAMLGITESDRRKRPRMVVCSRLFDTDDWLSEVRETVFENWIPIVPAYGNFAYWEDKVTYCGAVDKIIDPQRVLNYSLSREIEEGALAPRAKYWMTLEQAAGHERQLSTLNTNADPVQFFNPDERVPGPPQQLGGAQVNPGLRNISMAMQEIIGHAAGMFAANMGENPGLQSGIAIDALQDRGDIGTNKYISARECAQRHTGRILVNAIPRVYTPGRQIRLLYEDGGQEVVTVGEVVPDQQTGQMVVMNDLSQGRYDVICSSGPSFKNRQNETVSSLTEIGKVDPTLIELGSDILLKNITSPGMDDIAQRKRQQLFQAGVIPDDQLTEEELQIKQEMANQPPQESPEMVLARAEETKGQADMLAQQMKAQQIQQDGQIKVKQLEIDAFNAETARFEAQVKHAQAMAEIKGKGAAAAKSLAEAEAQELETSLVESGIIDLVDRITGRANG